MVPAQIGKFSKKIGTRIITGINNLGPPLGYMVQDMQMGLRQWLVMLWKARVVDRYKFLNLWF